jgi:CO/xanthine dehydrogenase Mo-binding subunit
LNDEPLKRFEQIEQVREFHVVGKNVARVDALDAVLGRPVYTGDLASGRPLFVKAVRSPYPHARIKAIDVSKARQSKSVRTVLTHKDIPGVNDAGSLISDRPLLAVSTVRHYGEAIALVVGKHIEDVEESVKLVRVEYAPLPVLSNPFDAMQPNAPRIHEDRDNIAHHFKIRKGDIAKGFADSDVLIENTYRTPFIDGLPLETEVAYAYPENGRITCTASMQNPFDVYHRVVKILGVEPEQLRLVQAAVGGGFGPKSDETPIDVAAYACLAVQRTGKPALAVFTREEAMIVQCKRHQFTIRHKTGATRDGRLMAWQSELVADTGAYISKGHLVIGRATFHCTGPYEVPHVWADGYSVYTSHTMAGSTRGFGAPQAHFAAERQMDELARKLAMDSIELRAKNLLRLGTRTVTSQRIDDAGLELCLDRVGQAIPWQKRRHEFDEFNQRSRLLKKGIGIALLYHGNTLGPEGDDFATVHMEVEPSGRVVVRTGLSEFGTGASTSLAIVTAEMLGIPLRDVRVERSDTSAITNSGPTVASRTTVVGGQAALDAARQILERLMQVASKTLQCQAEALVFEDGRVSVSGRANRSLAFQELVSECLRRGVQLSARGYYMAPPTKWDPETGQGAPYNQYTFGALVAEVEVDTETGLVKVKRLTATYDVGRAINPKGLRTVIEGGSIMALGYALMEEFTHDSGMVVTSNLHTYPIPTMTEAPDRIDSIIVESPSAFGAFGAKAMGEIPVVLPAAAIANAVAHATDVFINELPLRPEKVLRRIRSTAPS